MRLLVTRPEADGRRTAARLRALGHKAVLAPILTIRPTDEPPPPGSFAALVVTSANAASAMAIRGAGSLRAPCFTVGERTAAAVRAEGWDDVRVGAGDAAALARLAAATVRAGSALLLVAGRHRKREPEASLRAAGFPVTVWTAYEAAAADRLPREARQALEAGALDAALHYSRRSAATLVRLAREAGLLAPLTALPHLCLSADAAAPLAEAGASRLILADAPDEDSLLSALARVSPNRSREPGERC